MYDLARNPYKYDPVIPMGPPELSREEMNKRIRKAPLETLFKFHLQIDFRQILRIFRDANPYEFYEIWEKHSKKEKTDLLRSLNYHHGWTTTEITQMDLEHQIYHLLSPGRKTEKHRPRVATKRRRLINLLNPEILVALYLETLNIHQTIEACKAPGTSRNFHWYWPRFSPEQREAMILDGRFNKRMLLDERFKLTRKEQQFIQERNIEATLEKLNGTDYLLQKPQIKPSQKLIERWIIFDPQRLLKRRSDLLTPAQFKRAVQQTPRAAISYVPEKLDEDDIDFCLPEHALSLLLSNKTRLNDEQIVIALNAITKAANFREIQKHLPTSKVQQAGRLLHLLKKKQREIILQKAVAQI
jgi:hypothetical protein